MNRPLISAFAFLLLAAGSARAEQCNSIAFEYRCELGDVKLAPGESLKYALPSRYHSLPVEFVELSHRQEASETHGWDAGKKWDDAPAYTSLQFALANTPDEGDSSLFVYWGGPSSGEHGAKFAEVRSSPEIEYLYEWRKYGFRLLDLDHAWKSELFASAVRLVASGMDPVRIAGFSVKFLPPRPRSFVEKVFASGGDLGDYETAENRTSGSASPGNYENSLCLRSGEEILVPLEGSGDLVSADVMAGDQHVDETLGWGKLSVQHIHQGIRTSILNRANVGPEGVIRSFRPGDALPYSNGDQIRISASSDTVCVMGYRIGMNPE